MCVIIIVVCACIKSCVSGVQVLRRKGEVLVREREVERLARELEESHLNTLAHHLSQEEEGEKGRRERDKGHTLDATTHEVPCNVAKIEFLIYF